nr:beta-ketoacyl synthase chain length factor [Halorhodospira abdelmalekii]
MAGWAQARAALRGETASDQEAAEGGAEPELPPVTLLAANERRRLTATLRLALALAQEASDDLDLAERAALPTVFASAMGDSDITDRICHALAEPQPALSPTLFHNSVHNAPAGYWSVACASRAPSISVAAGEQTAGAGALEAIAQLRYRAGGSLLYVLYDTSPPLRLQPHMGIEMSFGMALRIGLAESTCVRPPAHVAHLHAAPTNQPVTVLPSPWERLRTASPAAHWLGLAVAVARQWPVVVVPLDAQRNLEIRLECAP